MKYKTSSKTDTSDAVKTASTLPVISGLRLTKQRQEVYQVLLEQRDHPTANEVYHRVRKKLPSISLATVYNCLEALVNHGLVNQVNFERSSSRFCPNLVDHGHFPDLRHYHQGRRGPEGIHQSARRRMRGRGPNHLEGLHHHAAGLIPPFTS